MRIRVDEIPDSGRFLHFHWDQDRFNHFLPADDPFQMQLVRPLNVDLEIQKRSDHIRVQGRLAGTLQVACHRCLNSFAWTLNEPVEVFLVPEDQMSEAEELELESRDLEYEFFDGAVIEIDQLVAEQIFLALPVKLLCSDECLGLCPRCGANLNEAPCDCEKRSGDAPFSALKALRDRLQG
jgi:uncharacterized protein